MEELLCSLGSRSRPEVIGLLPHIKYVPLFGNTPPPPNLLALSPSSFSTPLCGKHIFGYRINLMIISIHEVSHCKQYCTIHAFRYSIVGSDQLFWGRGGAY